MTGSTQKNPFKESSAIPVSQVLYEDNTDRGSWQYLEPIKSGDGHTSMSIPTKQVHSTERTYFASASRRETSVQLITLKKAAI
jgi:hypothetical protein